MPRIWSWSEVGLCRMFLEWRQSRCMDYIFMYFVLFCIVHNSSYWNHSITLFVQVHHLRHSQFSQLSTKICPVLMHRGHLRISFIYLSQLLMQPTCNPRSSTYRTRKPQSEVSNFCKLDSTLSNMDNETYKSSAKTSALIWERRGREKEWDQLSHEYTHSVISVFIFYSKNPNFQRLCQDCHTIIIFTPWLPNQAESKHAWAQMSRGRGHRLVEEWDSWNHHIYAHQC